MIIVNRDVKLRNGGRKAPAMSADSFIQLITDKLGPESLENVFTITDALDSDTYSKFWDDIQKIEISFENFGAAEEFYTDYVEDFEYSASYLHDTLPVLMTKSGVPYLCCSGGGDWEVPVVFMIYWDGKTFRGYIPVKGNPWNVKKKSAFNNYIDEDTAYIRTQGYPVFELTGNDDCIVADIDMCIEDFESRIDAVHAKNDTVSIDKEILENICTYCENQAVYDKLSSYGDFYYKIKRLLNNA